MIRAGQRAVLTCVDPHKVARDLVGRAFDEDLLAALPADVDPCAENGEFHTFVWDSPGFCEPIAFRVKETVERGGFVYADVVELD
jgi:diphthamide synthase (EF-2-diphthine--ammonia ligase)